MTDSGPPPIPLPNGSLLTAEDQRRLTRSDEHNDAWLLSLPGLITDWCERWQVALQPGFPAISYNLVLFGTSARHGPVAIKLSPPHDEITAEIEALRAGQAPGVVRLYDSDPTAAIMLQQRILPGTALHEHVTADDVSDTAATRIAAACMKRFWKPAPHNPRLITLDRWLKALYAYRDRHQHGMGPISFDIIDLAIHHADDLLDTEEDRYTVHGDINPGNILLDQKDGWIVIDPKGLTGERGYDVGTWILNPHGLARWPNLRKTLDTRLSILSEALELDRYRLWQWSVVHAALSSCWTAKDGAANSEDLNGVEIIRALRTLPEARR